MRTTLLAVILGMFTSAQASQAQLNIQSEAGDVTIGTDGINIKQGGQTVKLSPGGISIKKPNQTVKIQSSGVRGSTSRSSVQINSAAARVKKSGTVSRVKTTAVTVLSLEQRVSSLEIQAYGKKTTGIPLIARVEKLETDTLGAAGSGTITARVAKLAPALGVSETTKQTVNVNKSVEVSGGTPSIRMSSPGSSLDISGSGTSVQMNAGGGGGARDIVFDTSGYEGTVACNGGNVILNASTCNIKFTGAINALVLNGSSNDITCDTVRHVQVNGSANDVKWSRSANPSVANAGSANTLKSR